VKRVLVTGASGFIGSHALSALLDLGYEVHAVGRRSQVGAGVRWHAADLLDPKVAFPLLTAVKPTHLLHLAWYAVHGKFWTSTENARWVEATRILLEAFHRVGGQRVVAAGSCAEYDWTAGRCDEDCTALAAATEYGRCKNRAWEQMQAFSHQAAIDVAWARVFHLYGPHEPPTRFVAAVVLALLRDQDALCTEGGQLRDFLHVADVASAFCALLDSHVTGAVNLGSGQAVTLAEIAHRIADVIGRPHRIKLGARPMSSDDPRVLLPVLRRLTQSVGWTPRYDLNTGLQNTVDWWRKELDTNVGGCTS